MHYPRRHEHAGGLPRSSYYDPIELFNLSTFHAPCPECPGMLCFPDSGIERPNGGGPCQTGVSRRAIRRESSKHVLTNLTLPDHRLN